MSTVPRGSLRELFGPATRAIVLAGLVASFLASFDLLIVVSALPSAARDVGDIDNYALAAGAYSVASVVGMPLAGAVNDRIGPLRTLLVGSGVFFVGTVVGGTATSMDQIAAGRLLQGFGGGFLLSVPLVIWTAYLPRHLERYGFAVNAAVWAISAVIGPPIGALLVALVDWRAVFWVNLPLLALTVIFALRGFRGQGLHAARARARQHHRAVPARRLRARAPAAGALAADLDPARAGLPVAGAAHRPAAHPAPPLGLRDVPRSRCRPASRSRAARP